MSEKANLCIVVNKDGSALAPSESFLRAHFGRLPFVTTALVGNPGTRRTGGGEGPYLQSQTLPARAIRWAIDRAGVRSRGGQDSRALAKYLTANRTQVVMAEYGPTGLAILEACRQTGLPLVTHFHGWDAYVLASKPEARASYQRLFDRSEVVIAVSSHMRDHLVRLGSSSDKTVWNPCGAEFDETPGDPSAAPPLFVCVGRPAPKKATGVVLLAFARVLEHVPSARLEMIGAHADPPSAQLVRALQIGHAVTFCGPMTHAEVLQAMRRARCYIHPSVTAPDGDMEGTPVSVLEGMAAGLPVVSTRHGGILDVLEGTGAGILADEFDVPATAAAMLLYANDRARARADGEKGRALIRDRWSMQHSLDRLAEIIEAARSRDRDAIARLAKAVP